MRQIKRTQIFLFFLSLIVSVRLFNLQILEGHKFRYLSRANCIRIVPFVGPRGRILDRDKRILVDNLPTYEVAVFPQDISKIDGFLSQVSSILDIPSDKLKGNFNKISNSSLPLVLLNNLDKKTAIVIEELKFKFPQLIINMVPKRYYPYGNLASHLIGYLSLIDYWRLTKWQDYGYSIKDTVGYGGVEERYDYYLKSQSGGLQVEVDNRNRIVRILGYRTPKAGKDIQLTIDLKLQKIVEEALEGYQGAVVILDPHTGEVLAMASSPSFSPADFLEEKNLNFYFSASSSPLINRAISGLYPAGSIFKLILSYIGLEKANIGKNKTFFCEGVMKLGNEEFLCWDKHGSQNIFEAIVHSCNIFFYRLGLILGADLIHNYALKFGLGKPTGIDLPEEKAGFVPSPLLKRVKKFESWFAGDTANFSIGQGDLLVTPLGICRMISIFANGGKLIRPYIVKAIDGKDISKYQRKIIPLNLETIHMELINNAMRKVVEDPEGTAHFLYMPKIPIAGKTGTAQVAKKLSHAWFSGYFPADNPRYSICVILEHAGPSLYACKVTRYIIERMLEEGLL
ncbi:MAG: penicillin-binding protein 2 [Candidatus Omnitrophica bacterium]|nr:penicillin-binding protein 2 [Candidatus Omnitrophota bacterium]